MVKHLINAWWRRHPHSLVAACRRYPWLARKAAPVLIDKIIH